VRGGLNSKLATPFGLSTGAVILKGENLRMIGMTSEELPLLPDRVFFSEAALAMAKFLSINNFNN
jgi:hypothetical protein